VYRNGVDAFAPAMNGPCSRGIAGAGVMEMLIVVCARAARWHPNAETPSDVAPEDRDPKRLGHRHQHH